MPERETDGGPGGGRRVRRGDPRRAPFPVLRPIRRTRHRSGATRSN